MAPATLKFARVEKINIPYNHAQPKLYKIEFFPIAQFSLFRSHSFMLQTKLVCNASFCLSSFLWEMERKNKIK